MGDLERIQSKNWMKKNEKAFDVVDVAVHKHQQWEWVNYPMLKMFIELITNIAANGKQYEKKRSHLNFTSFEYVGDEFFSLDDGMMMQFDSILLSAVSNVFDCSTFVYRAACTNANSEPVDNLVFS